MLRLLMVVSGLVEIAFGCSALAAPLIVVEAVGGASSNVPTLAMIRLAGAATFGLGVAALFARRHLEAPGGLAAAYGLGLYNVLAAIALLFAAFAVGGSGLWAGAALHIVIGLLFCYALATRRVSTSSW